MNVLVMIKPVALLDSAVFTEDYSIRRDRSRHGFSPSDAYALRLARELKRTYPETLLHVISMASDAQAPLLESLKAYDIDSLILVTDPCFAKSDTLATSHILTQAIKASGTFDLILAGLQSTDSETGQVPGEVATLLGIPFVSSITEFSLQETSILCTRYLEFEKHTLEVPFPSLLSICSKGQGLEPTSLLGLRKARNVPTIRFTNQMLKIPNSQIGLEGSPSKVVRCAINRMDHREPLWIMDPLEGAKIIWDVVQQIISDTEVIEPKETTLTTSDPNLVVLSLLFDPDTLQTSLQILSHAAELGKAGHLLVLGELLSSEHITAFADAGAHSIQFLQCPENLADEAYASLISSHLGETVHTVLCGSSVRMRSCMAILAASTSSGLAADCTEFSYIDDALHVVRPAFGGNMEAVITLQSNMQMATIRPNAFPVQLYKRKIPPPIQMIHDIVTTGQNVLLSQSPFHKEPTTLSSIVFAIGNGVREQSIRDAIYEFGFSKAASRVAVNTFNLDYSLQVGQTGRLIKPKLYVGFGIHGAFQHIVGIKQSEKIIAVNHDKLAPIFDYADIAICCDAALVVHQLQKLIYKNTNGGNE